MNKIKQLFGLLLFTPALALAQSPGHISTSTFTEELFYADGPGSKYCNGNISSIRWKDNTQSSKRGYKFTYDTANRLTSGAYGEGDALSSNTGRYSESMSYDANGNIKTLERYGKISSGYGLMDKLSISYTGNQPTSVSESASDNNASGVMEYKKANGSGYIFNANGALVADKSRGIAYITYDYNNNPKQIYFTNGSVTKYVYSALGQKLRAVHYTAKPNISRTWGVKPAELTMAQILQADSTDYLMGGSLTMKNGKIEKFLFGGGYAQASVASSTTDNFAFYFYNQDHLGNIREVVNESGTVQQVTNYYPFGAPYADASASTNSDFQPYKYNGKELDKMHGLNTYDYGARQHDPILARWDRLDPLCEKYYSVSPYNYCGNSPNTNIDPDGMDWYTDKDGTIQYNPNVHSQADLGEQQSYLWGDKNNKKSGVNYRNDGSILYSNETTAYKRMWSQADKHYRTKNSKGGREVTGFILSDGKVLVLPDYKNDATTSHISGYGYKVNKAGYLLHGDESFKVLGNIHTHQEKTTNSKPSRIPLGESDLGISKSMGGLPVMTMGHDNMVHAIYYHDRSYSEFDLRSRTGLLNGTYRIYPWLKKQNF